MENKRVLITTTTPYMIRQFLLNDIQILQDLGYIVEVATNFQTFNVISTEELEKLKDYLKEKNIEMNQIDFDRSVSKINNHFKSYKQMKKLMNEKDYKIIHTHTPISSLITRLAYRKSNIYTTCKMIYTAHGFHFFKGNNPIKNFIFRNVEKLGARYTDVLITINKEDYEAAKKFKLRKNGTVEYVPGVGIDFDKINSIEGSKEELCKELNIPVDSTLLLSVGEVNDNKNHKTIIQTLPNLPDNIHYLICGLGNLMNEHKQLASELHVENRLHLLGYRSDVIKVMKSCDIFAFPSKREGLGLAAIEAMASGLPLITSNRHGINDYSKNEITGFTYDPFDCSGFAEGIKKIANDQMIRKQMGKNNKEAAKDYDKRIINERMFSIYAGN